MKSILKVSVVVVGPYKWSRHSSWYNTTVVNVEVGVCTCKLTRWGDEAAYEADAAYRSTGKEAVMCADFAEKSIAVCRGVQQLSPHAV
jgi:hypothetical protein